MSKIQNNRALRIGLILYGQTCSEDLNLYFLSFEFVLDFVFRVSNLPVTDVEFKHIIFCVTSF